MSKQVAALAMMALTAVASAVYGQTGAPCDASVEIGACRATVTVDGNWVILQSDTPRCIVVDWSLDGSGRRTTVLDGEERLELLTTRPKSVQVERCVEVQDLRGVSDRTPERPAAGPDSAGGSTQFLAVCMCSGGRIADKRLATLRPGEDAQEAARQACAGSCPGEDDERDASAGATDGTCVSLADRLRSAKAELAGAHSALGSLPGATRAEKCLSLRSASARWEDAAQEIVSLARSGIDSQCVSASTVQKAEAQLQAGLSKIADALASCP